jgi:hypothetical protein
MPRDSLDTDQQSLDEAHVLSYEPHTPGDLSPVPHTIGDALDDIRNALRRREIHIPMMDVGTVYNTP